MKLFVNGFWNGFVEKTDPVNIRFFSDLFKLVFKEDVTLDTDPRNSDILLESVFGESLVSLKEWKYSFLFMGESSANIKQKFQTEKYSSVLCGIRNNKNIVNVPLFVPYLYCNSSIDINKKIDKIPEKYVCTFISNPNGLIRNKFIEKIEEKIKVEHAGNYKNNVTHLQGHYNSENIFRFMSNYKFVITMENSEEDTYITEKIVNGFGAGIVPIYWGSKRVNDYFNEKRFLCLEKDDDESMGLLVDKVVELCSNGEKYKSIINSPLKTSENIEITIDTISKDIQDILIKEWKVEKIFVISSPIHEPTRYEKMKNLFKNNVEFVCPTYKQDITDEIFRKWVKEDLTLKMHNRPFSKSELSLFLNHVSILEHIEKRYKEGIFLVFESDVYPLDLSMFNNFIQMIETKKNEWDLISIGAPYSEKIFNDWWNEELTKETDKIRLIQKKVIKCTDSLVWSYSGIKKFLNFLKAENNNYSLPFDTHFDDIICKKYSFKLYWSTINFFSQESHDGLCSSTIR